MGWTEMAAGAVLKRYRQPCDRYQIVVAKRSYVPSIWDWEIYRDGEPLPARLQGSGLRSEVAAKGAVHKITQLLPPEGDEPQYRIKSENEPHERVVKESRLKGGA